MSTRATRLEVQYRQGIGRWTVQCSVPSIAEGKSRLKLFAADEGRIRKKLKREYRLVRVTEKVQVIE